MPAHLRPRTPRPARRRRDARPGRRPQTRWSDAHRGPRRPRRRRATPHRPPRTTSRRPPRQHSEHSADRPGRHDPRPVWGRRRRQPAAASTSTTTRAAVAVRRGQPRPALVGGHAAAARRRGRAPRRRPPTAAPLGPCDVPRASVTVAAAPDARPMSEPARAPGARSRSCHEAAAASWSTTTAAAEGADADEPGTRRARHHRRPSAASRCWARTAPA